MERQGLLVQLIEEKGRILVPEVCEKFGVSIATARRDLDAIAEQGFVRRVHGGAISARRAPPEGPALERAQEQAAEKRAIGKAAADLVGPGETIFLGSGTTVLEVARQLVGRKDLTVITNSLLVIDLFAHHPNITLIALGGMLRRSEMSFIGALAEQGVAELRANRVIIGIRAVDLEQGLTNDYLAEASSDRAIIRAGRELVVVADHSKLGRVSSGFVAPLSALHTLVTDDQVRPDMVKSLKERKVRVIVAESE